MGRARRGGRSTRTGLSPGRLEDSLATAGTGFPHGSEGHRLHRFRVATEIEILGAHAANGPGALQHPKLATEVSDGVGGAAPETTAKRYDRHTHPDPCEDQQ